MSITFESLCDSLERGNEIEFQYNDKKYSIFPNWVDNTIIGYYIGIMYGEYDIVCRNQLREYKIESESFIDLIDKIIILNSSIPVSC